MKRWILLLICLGFLVVNTTPSSGAGFIIVEDPHWWPGTIEPQPIPPRPGPPPWPRPLPPPHQSYRFAPLEVTYVKVQTRINDQVAATSVDEEFHNPNPSRLEGTFLFPIPQGAHIDRFTMTIDGRQVEAELLSTEKARRIYEDIVRKAQDPALLEYAGRDLLKVRIFPIEPHSRKRITISYTQLLKADDGLVSYVLPLNTEKFSARPIKNVSVKIELDGQRPLKSIYSPSQTVEIRRHGDSSATIAYEASEVQAEPDLELFFAREKDPIGVNLLTYKTSGEDGYFLLLASPGMETREKQVLPKDVAFVLDTSGSMAGKKLDQAKKALLFCVENLNDADRFEIIRFSTEVEPLFDQLTEASPKNRARAGEFIQGLKPMGGTAIDDALRQALRLRGARTATENGASKGDRPFVVIFLTDGRPTIGAVDETEIVKGVKSREDNPTRIFCFGIGTDVNTHLLDRITEMTRGFSQYVLPDEDLEMKVSNFFSKIKEPVLADPRLKFTGDIRVAKLYPSPLPDLFKGQQLVLAGRYSGSGDSAVILEGTVNGSNRKFTYEVKFPAEASENEFIPRLWATRRVGHLLDEIRLRGDNSELREEATELARKYGLVTPHTAYLIMEDEARRQVPAASRSLQSLDRDRGARDEAAKNWHEFKDESGGEKAVFNSRYGLALKSATAAAPAASGAAVESQRSLGLSTLADNRPSTSAESGRTRLAQYAQQASFVAGKNFFQNDGQWIDSAIQKQVEAKRVRIQFGSPEYFNLAAREPKILPWLSLGQEVQFVFENKIYQVYK